MNACAKKKEIISLCSCQKIYLKKERYFCSPLLMSEKDAPHSTPGSLDPLLCSTPEMSAWIWFRQMFKIKLFQGQQDLDVTLDVMNYRGFLKSFGCFFQLFHRSVSAEFNQNMKALQYLSMASMVTYLCIHIIVYLCNCICCKCTSPTLT